ASRSASWRSSSTTTSRRAWSGSTPRSRSGARASSRRWRGDGGAMAFGKAHRRGHIVAEINVTPLTDVFLVLLIIFMITTSAMVKPAAAVDLPKAPEHAEYVKRVPVTITPSRDIFVNERPVGADDAGIVTVLRDALEKSPEKVVLLAG